MSRSQSLLSRVALCALVAIALAAPAQAAPENVLAIPSYHQEAVVWDPVVEDDLVLSIAGPCIRYSERFRRGEQPFFRMEDDEGQLRRDGVYAWELHRIIKVDQELLDSLREAHEIDDGSAECKLQDAGVIPSVLVQSGVFTVDRGLPYFDDQAEERRIAVPAGAVAAGPISVAGGMEPVIGPALSPVTDRTVISGNLTVYNAMCVGFDCLSNETYNADSIRLKENNLRIHFDDTSTASGFPNRDWRIVANDQASGGLSKFAIDDVSASRTVFTIEGNAAANSLYVDTGGRIGITTNSPTVELHVKNGDTPTLRLEQDGSSGFAPQIWDVAGNETSFFVRDASNGSTLPFRIFPGAASGSLIIDDTNNVGIGTNSPTEALHIRRTDGNPVGFAFEQTSGGDPETWFFRNNPANGAFVITDNAGGAAPFKVFDDIAADTLVVGTAGGAQEVAVTGTLRVNGTAMTVPDYVFDPDFELESIDDHAAAMWQNKHLPAVSPARYDKKGRASVDVLGNQLGMLEELEKAHIYIEQLHQRIVQLEQDRDQTLVEMAQRLERLELDQGAAN
jgi:hypothetical protein